jgi:hypothetical protein
MAISGISHDKKNAIGRHELKKLVDKMPYLFYWVLPVAILGFFFRPLWYGLALVVGMSILAGLSSLFRRK